MEYEFLNEKEIFYINEISEEAERIYREVNNHLAFNLYLINGLTAVVEDWHRWDVSGKDDDYKAEYIERLKDSIPILLFIIHKSCGKGFDLLREYNYQNRFTKNKGNLTRFDYFLTIRFNNSAEEMKLRFYHVIGRTCDHDSGATAGAVEAIEYIYMIIEELGITLEEVLEYTWNEYIK